MRSFVVVSITLLGASLLLSSGAVRIGSAVFPEIAVSWTLVLIAVLLMLAGFRRAGAGAGAMRFSRFLVVASLLALSAWRLGVWWEEGRKPVSPLTVRVSGTVEASRVESLKLADRRYLARIAGRRRNFELDIEGFLFVPRAGRYGLELDCDDWCDLRLDGVSLLTGAGTLERSLDLEPGTKRFELRYRQEAGPAFLLLRWDPPGLVELFPIESHLSATASTFEPAAPRYHPATSWGLLLLGCLWLTSAAFASVRGAESVAAWAAKLGDWWRRPPPLGPVALVRPLAWALTGGALFAFAAVAKLRLPVRLEGLTREYAVSPRRGPFVLERVETFPDYLFFLAALCVVVAIVLRSVGTLPTPPASARWRGWLLAAIGASLLWGAWISQSEWVRDGRPCYDGYCDYAERVRDLVVAPGAESWKHIRDHLARNYHANSPVGPVLIAGLSFLLPGSGPDIVPAYRLLSAISTLGTLLLLLRLATHELGLGSVPSLVGALLFAASGSIQRSFLFPQTDAVAMFFFTLAVERALTLRRHFAPVPYVLATAALAVALLTKLSALPLVGIVFVVLAWPTGGPRRSVSTCLRDGARAASVVLPPALLALAFVLALRTSDNVRTELHRIETLDSRLSFHVVATLVTLLPFFVAVAITVRRKWGPIELMLATAVGIYLVGLWSSGASGWERFYLNAMPIALPLAVTRLTPLPDLHSARHVMVLSVSYSVAHAVRMVLHLYNGA